MDARIRRAEQAITALVLAAAYAFSSPILVTAWTVLLAVSIVAESLAVVRLGLARLFDRVGLEAVPVDAAPVRFASILAVTLLIGACALLWTGLDGLGWILTLAVAVSAALSALTNICLGCELFVWLRRRTNRA